MRRPELGFSLLVFFGSLALVALFAIAGWPGAPNHCVLQGDCYCEATRLGPIAQPANTWSLLPFSIAGLVIAWRSERTRRSARAARENRMVGSTFYPALYCGILVFMGPGGAFFHASLTDWGGAVDVLSMFLWIDFLIFYDLASMYDWSRARFLTTYLGSTALFLVPRILYGPSGVPLFAVVFTLWLLVEAYAALDARRPASARKVPFTRDRRWLVAHLVTSIVAFAIWSVSHGGGPLCRPESLLQGHAVWHVLNAVAFVMIYPYLRSERPHAAAA